MKTLPVSEAIQMLKDIVPLAHIAKLMGIKKDVLTQASKHHIVNGKPYYLPASRLESLRSAVRTVGEELRDFRFRTDLPDYAIAEQIKELPTNNKYLCTSGLISMSYSKLNNKLTDRPYTSKGREYNYYNCFTPEEIKEIQTAIRTIGADLINLEIEMEYPPTEGEE